ncbi:MAG TPA: hypothetical protein VFK19_12775 [Sphingomicrobium sp.]|nr:hypothetical protein [Sphingomicrobium sp.]
MSQNQADEIRTAIATLLEAAKEVGAVRVVFRAEDVSEAVVGTASNHPNVLSALTGTKMREQTGFGPGKSDRDYQSSAALISFEI